jgi:protein-S-isoprenylcysteine O-methyltransferase Ste14
MKPLKFFVDMHKGATGPVMLALLLFYNQTENPTAWVYLALHGMYGLLWVLKSRLFPDRQWERPVSWLYGVVAAWGGLTLYWVGGWLVMARGVQAPGWLLAFCISIYGLGLFFHFAADMQKYVALQLRPGHLIVDGFWSLSRNPNYFGELLIYSGFGLLALHWLPLLILGVWVLVVWFPLMIRKDRSLARYPEFDSYTRRVARFIPFLL